MKLNALLLTLAVAMTTTTAVYSLSNRISTAQACVLPLTQTESLSCH